MAKSNKSAPPPADGALIPPADGSAPPPVDGALIPPAPPTDKEAVDVTVRVLVATEVGDKTYQPNQLVRFTADVYASLDKARVDDGEAALAYLESIGVVVVRHDEQGDDGEQS